MTKECKVVMLPTEDKTNIIKDRGVLEYIENKQIARTINSIVEGFHIYIICDDEIKEDDFYFYQNEVVRCSFVKNGWAVSNVSPFYTGLISEGIKKIIASTDISLGLPTIQKSFLEVYVKAKGKIDKVMAEHNQKETGNHRGGTDFIMGDVKVNPNNTLTLYFYAKRKEPKLYTETQLKKAYRAGSMAMYDNGYNNFEDYFKSL